MTKKLLDRIYIKQPCSESWEQMTGNTEVRFCSHCAKNVYDLSRMSRARAEKLIQDSSGKLCARYVILGSNVPPPPAPFAQITRRATVAATVLAGSLAMSSFVSAQGESSDVGAVSNSPRTVVMKMVPRSADTIVIAGIVRDSNGALVPGATVILRSTDTGKTRTTVSDSEASFVFNDVELGEYEIEITAPGFVKLIRAGLKITESVTLEETVGLDEKSVLMGVVAFDNLPIAPTTDGPDLTIEPRPRPLEWIRQPAKTERKKKKNNSLPK